MINDTLCGVFPVESNNYKQAELFSAKVMSVLYSDLFKEDSNKGDIQRLIDLMKIRAK